VTADGGGSGPPADGEPAETGELAGTATPGPRFVRFLDDGAGMRLVAAGTTPGTGRGERWPAYDHGEIVAATLVRTPRHVDAADERRDENARFITGARQTVPRPAAGVGRLRRQLARRDGQDPEAS
jgi:hypothetical protein